MESIEPVSSSAQPVDEPTKQYQNGYASMVSRRQYLSKRTADVFFTFEDSNERVPAHKSVLAAASEVFDKMFYGPMAVNGDVSLPGKPTEAFKTFLQFCYLDQVGLKSNNITDVMSLLHEYQMKDGLVVCGKYLAENWTFQDICSVYDWAINLEMDELRSFCERKIRAHCKKMFKTDAFLSCSFKVLDHILAFDSMLCDESIVLGACLDWARHKCKQNGKDGDDVKNLSEFLINKSNGKNLLWKIRYGSIPNEEILKHLNAIDAILEDGKERTDVTRLLLKSKHLESGKFLPESRSPYSFIWNLSSLECDLLAGLLLDKKEFASRRILNVLTVDGFTLLEGFYNVPLYAQPSYTQSRTFPAEFSITEQPIGQNNSKVVYENRFTFKDNRELYFELKPDPIILKPGFEYRFEFCFESSHITYHRFKIIKKVKVNEHDSISIRSPEDESGAFIMKKLKLKSLN